MSAQLPQEAVTTAVFGRPEGSLWADIRTVAVSVATVWTSPASPRSLDAPILSKPVEMSAWLGSLSLDDKLDLYSGNRIQTQALYGTAVLVLEELGEWVKIAIPDQPTGKDGRGYPGWVPAVQLERGASGSAEWKAVVLADKTGLYADPEGSPELTLAFLTELPCYGLTPDSGWIQVVTPQGLRYLPASEVRVLPNRIAAESGGGRPQLPSSGMAALAAENETLLSGGEKMVKAGKRFLGLPYLWGGMSSYGYDCSGFAYNMHRSQGIIIPRDASDQARRGAVVEKGWEQPGDLLFFAYENGTGAVHHVGMYAGEGKMIHSPDSASSIELVELSTYKLLHEHCATRRYWGDSPPKH
ncbi:C40 family peptidase [Gorillibacterium timonense]|uniref:C40 family peptidase n=1 Tax=Gorillibacterium timonense TaxID=1689269 RepID=UPI0009EBCEDE|nr:C40 family peptidase [Gorillibacterium timonense]